MKEKILAALLLIILCGTCPGIARGVGAPEPIVIIKTKRLGEQIFTRKDEFQFYTKPSDLFMPKRKEAVKNFIGYYVTSSISCPTEEAMKVRYTLKSLIRETPPVVRTGAITPEKTFSVAQIGGYQGDQLIPDGVWDKVLVTYELTETGKVLWNQEITVTVTKGEFEVEYKDISVE